MFASRDRTSAASAVVDVAFTDRHGGVSSPPFESLDLSRSRPDRADELAENLARVAAAFDVAGFAQMRQVHGNEVRIVDEVGLVPDGCDALVTAAPGVALSVRVGDCVPVVLADLSAGVIGVAHAGRDGVVGGVVPATVAAMRGLGAVDVEAWIGPHVCGGCYEVPASMRDDVTAVVPSAYACTTWGTPSVDLGAAVNTQLAVSGCTVHDRTCCTFESPDLYSHRRDGAASGRLAGIVVRRSVIDG